MKRTILKAFALPLGFCAGALGSVMFLQTDLIDMTPSAPPSSSDVMHGRESVKIPGKVRMTRMIASETCWAGGEGHPMPSRVWIRTHDSNSGAAYALRGEAVVSQALEQIFEGADHQLDIVAFCK